VPPNGMIPLNPRMSPTFLLKPIIILRKDREPLVLRNVTASTRGPYAGRHDPSDRS
jgi:hypothetical protein